MLHHASQPRAPASSVAVQDLAVVVGGVVVGGEVRADPELLEHDRLAEASCELAGEGGRQQLPQLVVLHRVGVRAEEVDERRERTERVAVVATRHLDPPGAVAERDRAGSHPLRGRPGRRAAPTRRSRPPRPGRRRAASRSRRASRRPPDAAETAGRARRRTTPVARRATRRGRGRGPLTPRRIPVLAGHVADDERRDRPEPVLRVRVEEVGEAVDDIRHRVAPARGTKSGQKQNDRVTFNPCSASTCSSSRTTAAS